MKRAVPFEHAGFRGLCLPEAEAAAREVARRGPLACARAGTPLREAVSRLTARVAWAGVGPVLLKAHRPRSLRERALGLVRRGRARAEWDAARHLAAAGLPVPRAVAYGQRRAGGLPGEAFYAADFLEGMRTLGEALAALASDEGETLLWRSAALVRRMHAADFDHRDLHEGNVLVGPGGGGAALVLTDLHRSRIGAVGDVARRRAVARWLHSVRALAGPEARRAWLRAYLGPERRDLLDGWAADVERRMRGLEAVRRRSRAKRCLKDSTVYTRDVGRGRGGRRRDLPRERLEEALAAHAAARAGGPGFVKRSRRGVVTRHQGIVVKEQAAPGLLGPLRDALWPARHASGYRHAHLLAVLGVGTARPLAHVRRDGRAYTLYEDLGDLPRLDHLAGALYAGDDRAAQRRLRDASAAWLGGLHREGVYHGDLKGVNVLVDARGGTPRFLLIDTDRCRFGAVPVEPRRRVKNLAQLAASIPRRVSRTERLRWYRRYLVATGLREDARQVARDVARHLARKVVVVDEPIE